MAENITQIDDMKFYKYLTTPHSDRYLSVLINELILERVGVSFINDIKFQAIDESRKPGVDGELDLSDQYSGEFCPKGKSVWELSVRKDVSTKANEDFNKRKNSYSKEDSSGITYVYATFCKMENKEDWVSKKKSEGIWKDVIVYDEADFKLQFNNSHIARIMFLDIINENINGLYSVKKYWDDNFARITMIENEIPYDFHLLSRKSCCDKLDEFIESEGRLKFFRSNYFQKDASGFLLAYFNSKNIERSVIVAKNYESLKTLKNLGYNGIVIFDGEYGAKEQQIKNVGSFSILVPIKSTDNFRKNTIFINKINKSDFNQKLKEIASLKDSEISKLTTISNGSIDCLDCFLSGEEGVNEKNDCSVDINHTLSLFSADKIDANNNGDIEFIKTISAMQFSEIEEIVLKLEAQEHPFVQGVGKKIACINKGKAWFYLAPKITFSMVEPFINNFPKVLLDFDPKWDLDESKRIMASIYDALPNYSDDLKQGICESLLFMTIFSEVSRFGDRLVGSIKLKIEEVLEALDTWQKWASIDNYLPLLSEVAPQEFLNKLERDIKDNSDMFIELFSDEYDTFTGGGCKFSGLLWSLEALSSHEEYFSRVIEILFNLSKLDKGIKWNNRPKNTLKSMFCYWKSQTPIAPSKRIDVLEKMRSIHGELLDDIIKSAISMNHSIDISYPKLANFDDIYKDTESERSEYYMGLSKLLIDSYKNKPEEFIEFYKNLGFHRCLQFEFLKVLDAFDQSCISKENKYKIWLFIKEEIYNYQQFSDSPKWYLPKEENELLFKLYDNLYPKDEIDSIAWIFDFYPKIIDSPKDLKERKAYDAKKQKEILCNFIETNSIGELEYLLEKIPDIYTLAKVSIDFDYTKEVENIILDYLASNIEKKIYFAKLFIYLYSKENLEFAIKIQNNSYNTLTYLKVLSSVGYTNTVREKILKLEEEEKLIFWDEMIWNFIDNDSGFIDEILLGLLSVNKIRGVLNLSFLTRQTLKFSTLITVFNKIKEDRNIIASNYYEISNLFKKFYKYTGLTDTEKQQVLDLELIYIPLFTERHIRDKDLKPLYLYEALQANPEKYFEFINIAYKNDELIPSCIDKNKVDFAYSLLNNLDFVPGYNSLTKIFDREVYKNWINRLFNLAKKNKYFKATIFAVLNIFTNTPIDEDGIWPDKALREILENEKNVDLERNLAIAKMNRRGVTTRSVSAGGVQEYEKAKIFREQARKVSLLYPRTTILLNLIADSYERMGKWYDESLREQDL